jgi:hypothetical protein
MSTETAVSKKRKANALQDDLTNNNPKRVKLTHGGKKAANVTVATTVALPTVEQKEPSSPFLGKGSTQADANRILTSGVFPPSCVCKMLMQEWTKGGFDFVANMSSVLSFLYGATKKFPSERNAYLADLTNSEHILDTLVPVSVLATATDEQVIMMALLLAQLDNTILYQRLKDTLLNDQGDKDEAEDSDGGERKSNTKPVTAKAIIWSRVQRVLANHSLAYCSTNLFQVVFQHLSPTDRQRITLILPSARDRYRAKDIEATLTLIMEARLTSYVLPDADVVKGWLATYSDFADSQVFQAFITLVPCLA